MMFKLPWFTSQDMQVVGAVPVDSGQLMIVDPCYVVEGAMYDDICNATTTTLGYERVGDGFVTSTVYGDGMYPCLLYTSPSPRD